MGAGQIYDLFQLEIFLSVLRFLQWVTEVSAKDFNRIDIRSTVGRVWLSAPERDVRINFQPGSFLENRFHSMPRSGRAEPDAPYHRQRRPLSRPSPKAPQAHGKTLISIIQSNPLKTAMNL